MFDSGISAAELIKSVKEEADIAPDIPDKTFLLWLTALEQLLYSEIIKEQKEIILNPVPKSPITTETLSSKQKGESPVRYEDIHTIYADDRQLIRSTLTSGVILQDTFFKERNGIGYHVRAVPNTLRILYFVRPDVKTEGTGGNVMVPAEFLDLVRAKLRGEAYKLANEDGQAAKWMNDYNILLETFKAWIAAKEPNFGM